jgi:hypothetical protein
MQQSKVISRVLWVEIPGISKGAGAMQSINQHQLQTIIAKRWTNRIRVKTEQWTSRKD